MMLKILLKMPIEERVKIIENYMQKRKIITKKQRLKVYKSVLRKITTKPMINQELDLKKLLVETSLKKLKVILNSVDDFQEINFNYLEVEEEEIFSYHEKYWIEYKVHLLKEVLIKAIKRIDPTFTPNKFFKGLLFSILLFIIIYTVECIILSFLFESSIINTFKGLFLDGLVVEGWIMVGIFIYYWKKKRN